MKKLAVLAIFVVFAVLATRSVWAQTQTKEPRWGLQVDLGTSFVPKALTDKLLNKPRPDKTSGTTKSFGLVRLNEKGWPSFGLYYSEVRLEATGFESRPYGTPRQFQPAIFASDPLTTIERGIDGQGFARGVMVTKFANFVAKKHVGFGMRFGVGVGQYSADYTRSVRILTESGKEYAPFTQVDSENYRHVWPLFEVLTYLDIKPTGHFSVGPIFGIRNGALVGGGSLTLRF